MRTEQKQKFDWNIVGVGIVLAIVVGGFAMGYLWSQMSTLEQANLLASLSLNPLTQSLLIAIGGWSLVGLAAFVIYRNLKELPEEK